MRMETINDRMEMLVNERFDGNKAAFAKAIAVEPATMSSYLGNKRRSKPSVDMIVKIVTKLDVDAYWLLTGEKKQQTSVVGHHNQVNGDGAQGNINGNVEAIGDAILTERVKTLEALVAEKERLIKVYEKMMEGRG